MPLFESVIVVDWSAASKPTTGKDSIWIAHHSQGGETRLENIPTRHQAIETLANLLSTEVESGRGVLVGFDFPFGYPKGVAGHITGSNRALALWDWLAERVEDAPDNSNNRYTVASNINAAYDGTGPCWGRPAGWNYPDIPTTATERTGDGHPPERRIADARTAGAKTVWQLAYAGSVGSQVVMGLPALHRLRHDPRIAASTAVWPLETGLTVPDAQIVIAEVYPSLIEPDPSEAIRDAGQVKAVARALSKADGEDQLADLFCGPPSLTADEREVIEREEAWILGSGQEHVLRLAANSSNAPAPLRYQRDPAEIYRKSFETVRAEARLDHLPADLHDIAIRLVHACGIPDVTARLAWSSDVAASARKSLADGAPILCDCEAVASMVVRSRLTHENPVICTLNAPQTREIAAEIGNTRSAAAITLWRDNLQGAVVAIGNAPTALFHLMELIDQGYPKPAAILGFPVGFVGAAESKAELAARPRAPFLTLRGRRGGSAMAAAVVNALAAGLETPR